MSKLEFVLALAIGQISAAISYVKTRPQSPTRDRWIKGLKSASAALTEILSDNSEDM